MVTSDLHQLGVLVTRPAHQAAPLCDLIEACNGKAVRLPVLEIGPPVDVATAKGQLAELAEYQMVIFISPNAVSGAKALLAETDAADLPQTCQIVCVGQGTARQLMADFQRQPDVIPESGFNSEALLALPALQQVAGQRIMIIRGEGGRPLLGDTLLERGAEVIYANVYERRLPAVGLESIRAQMPQIQVIVLTSGEGLRNLWQMAKDEQTWLINMPLLVVNPRLASIASELGHQGEIITAVSAADEAIVTALADWAVDKSTNINKGSV